jgi:hypothetical protein
MMKIAIVGSYGAAEKSALTDLLFTPDDDIGIRSYRSVETMTGDRQRPDFDLVVLMARVICPNLAALRRTLMTPILHLTLGCRQTDVRIESHIAIVELVDATVARDQRIRFAMAAMRRSDPTFKHTDWPTKLVPREHLKPAPHPRR